MIKYTKITKKEGVLVMDKAILNYVVEKTNELMNAPSCSNEAKTAAAILEKKDSLLK